MTNNTSTTLEKARRELDDIRGSDWWLEFIEQQVAERLQNRS